MSNPSSSADDQSKKAVAPSLRSLVAPPQASHQAAGVAPTASMPPGADSPIAAPWSSEESRQSRTISYQEPGNRGTLMSNPMGFLNADIAMGGDKYMPSMAELLEATRGGGQSPRAVSETSEKIARSGTGDNGNQDLSKIEKTLGDILEILKSAQGMAPTTGSRKFWRS